MVLGSRILSLLVLPAVAMAPLARAASTRLAVPFTMLGSLFITDTVTAAARLPEDDSFGDYYRRVAREINEELRNEASGPPSFLAVTMIVKPSGKTAFWFDGIPHDFDGTIAANLDKRLRQIPAPHPNGGPLAIRLIGYLWGETKEDTSELVRPTLPKAWRERVSEWRAKTKSEKKLNVDEVVELVLPN